MITIDELERRRFTADEVLRMLEAGVLCEDEPLELLDGALVIVRPQGPLHITALQIVAGCLRSVSSVDAHVRVQAPLTTSTTSMPEPDVALVRGDVRDYRDRHPSGEETILVVEVALTSQALDRAKAAMYAKAGVPQYWIVDLEARRLEVSSSPNAERGEYGVTRIFAETESVDDPVSGGAWAVMELLP